MPFRPGTCRLHRTPLSLFIERALFSSAAAIALGGVLLPTPASSATIAVTHLGDTAVANPATCTLRQAVVSMNTGAVTGNGCIPVGTFGNNDRVEFANALFSSGTPTITLQQMLTVGHSGPAVGSTPTRLTKHLTIDAGAGRQVIIERDPVAPHFAVIGAWPAGKPGDFWSITRGSLHLTGLIVQNGYAAGPTFIGSKYADYRAGGGVFASQADLIIERSTIRNNRGEAGGGVFVTGSLVVDSSTISGNVTPLYILENGDRGGSGGGIYHVGPATIRNSTISGNVSNGEAGGAAIASKYQRGNTPGAGITIVNSTISGNRAPEAFDAAGAALIVLSDDPALTLLNTTITDNCGGQAAIRMRKRGQASISTLRMTASSTVFANTVNAACAPLATPTVEIAVFDLPVLVEGSRNLLRSNSAIDPNVTFATPPVIGNPQLGPLQNNGGPTSTHALGVGSAARNAGSNPAGLAEDQRGAGFSRTVATTDIGAFEDPVIGLCGTAHGGAFTTTPSTNLCSGGAVLQAPVGGGGPWSWFCALPADPDNNAFCGARVLANVSMDVWNQGGSSIASAVWGQTMQLRASVTDTGPGGTPTGALTFADVTGGGFRPVCVDLPVAFPTVCNPALLPIDVGARQIRAVYGGSGTHGPASSANRALTLTRAVSVTSVLSQTPNPVPLGAPFTLTAGVALNAPSAGIAYGPIEIKDTTNTIDCNYQIGSVPPGCALIPTSVGVHQIEVSYIGNGNIMPSTIATTQTVTPGATTTDVLLSRGAIVLGQSVTVTAALATAVPALIATPSGTLAVGDGAGANCLITLPATSCELTPGSIGMRTVTASYAGDGNFAPTSDTAALNVLADPLFANGFE